MFAKNLSSFYEEVLIRWSKHLSFPVSLPSTIKSQYLWFNKDKSRWKMYLIQRFFPKGFKLCKRIIWLKKKAKKINNSY